jgi:hypothetical protein
MAARSCRLSSTFLVERPRLLRGPGERETGPEIGVEDRPGVLEEFPLGVEDRPEGPVTGDTGRMPGYPGPVPGIEG